MLNHYTLLYIQNFTFSELVPSPSFTHSSGASHHPMIQKTIDQRGKFQAQNFSSGHRNEKIIPINRFYNKFCIEILLHYR